MGTVSKPDKRVAELLAEALACHRAGRLSEAEQLYAAILEIENRNTQALTLLGTLHGQRGEFEEAARLLGLSLSIDQLQPLALNNLGNALNELKRHDEAVASYDKAIALTPDQPAAHNNRGDALRALKRHDEAIASYDRAIALRPDSADAYFNRAIALQEAERHEEARMSYDKVIALEPEFAEAHNNRGNALTRLRHYGEALASYESAIRLKPDFAQAHNNRGIVLAALGRHSDALASYDKAVLLKPDYAEAYSNRGDALRELKRYEAALASYDEAIALKADFAEAHNNRGYTLEQLQRYPEALASYDIALALKPNFVQVYLNRGNVLKALKRPQEALASFEKAIAPKPDYAEAYTNRGLVLQVLNRRGEALASHDAAIALKPDYAEAFNNRGVALKALNRRREALASYDRAIELQPSYADAYQNRGDVQRDLRRHDLALESYDRAIALRPDDAGAFLGRSVALRELRRYDEALTSIERAIALDPNLPYALGERLVIKLRMCEWAGFREACDVVVESIGRGAPAAVPFPLLGIDCPPDTQRKCAEIYVQEKCPPPSVHTLAPLQRSARARRDKIRVAYVSANFNAHAVASLMAGVFEQHARDKFEISAISFAHDDGSLMRARLENAFEHFLDVREKDDQEVAALLRAREVDIAVDMMGFTRDSRPGIFALRPAPIQVNYLGYPGTMGADFIDYILVDRIIVPPAEQAHYSEKLVYLPHSYMPFDIKRRIAGRTPTRAAAGLPAEGLVFCSFNNVSKIVPPVFEIWMRLLGSVAGSVLWLSSASPAAALNLRREAEAHGVASERIVFAPFIDEPAEHVARLSLADLFLDTLPYNAHAGGLDALWAGVPILSCMGSTFAGRVGASLLSAIGMPELVTHSLAEYEARALLLARDPSALAEVKEKLLRNRTTQPLFDTARFTRHLETAYTRMMERHRGGEPPMAFAVDALENA